jgi:hypothetical protein
MSHTGHRRSVGKKRQHVVLAPPRATRVSWRSARTGRLASLHYFSSVMIAREISMSLPPEHRARFIKHSVMARAYGMSDKKILKTWWNRVS